MYPARVSCCSCVNPRQGDYFSLLTLRIATTVPTGLLRFVPDLCQRQYKSKQLGMLQPAWGKKKNIRIWHKFWILTLLPACPREHHTLPITPPSHLLSTLPILVLVELGQRKLTPSQGPQWHAEAGTCLCVGLSPLEWCESVLWHFCDTPWQTKGPAGLKMQLGSHP